MRIDIQLEEQHKSTRIQVYDELRTVFREHKRIPPRVIRKESTETLLPLRTLEEYDVDFMLEFMQRLKRVSHWKYVAKVSVK
jgi:Ser-tRNA(Ala) deacylase AlaX